jgi:LmbE family N-acetylglucosaminyl deacetylase
VGDALQPSVRALGCAPDGDAREDDLPSRTVPMIRTRLLPALVALLSLAAPRAASGQARGAVALDQLVRGLTTTSRVLVIGAHPDDEDTQLLAWLARGHQVHVAYLSLTRGDGGQNLIGNELGEALGAIRSEELLAARRLDGAQQFFSRAYDFGFSKDADETFRQWQREPLTADVVRVIRAYRPHVVIAVWSGTRADGHGHHEAAGILARDGFEAAGDTVRFPVAVHGRAWMPQKFYRGAWARALPPTLTFDVGGYDAVLGRSPAELAAASRSMHRSQGQGGLERRGAAPSRLTRELTRVNAATPATEERSIFDGLDTSVAHLAALDSAVGHFIRSAAAKADWAQRTLDLRRPAIWWWTRWGSWSCSWRRRSTRRIAAARCRRGVGRPRGAAVRECRTADLELETSLERMLARAQRALLEAAGDRDRGDRGARAAGLRRLDAGDGDRAQSRAPVDLVPRPAHDGEPQHRRDEHRDPARFVVRDDAARARARGSPALVARRARGRDVRRHAVAGGRRGAHLVWRGRAAGAERRAGGGCAADQRCARDALGGTGGDDDGRGRRDHVPGRGPGDGGAVEAGGAGCRR